MALVGGKLAGYSSRKVQRAGWWAGGAAERAGGRAPISQMKRACITKTCSQVTKWKRQALVTPRCTVSVRSEYLRPPQKSNLAHQLIHKARRLVR